MAVAVVVFDVGETLVDETHAWERLADTARVPRFTLMGLVGGLAARGEPHDAQEMHGVGITRRVAQHFDAEAFRPCQILGLEASEGFLHLGSRIARH